MHYNNESPTMDRKKFSGVTKQLDSLYKSSQLLEKWKECSEGNMDIGIKGKDRKAAVVYARAVYAEFTHRKADDPRKAYFNDPTQFKEGPVHSTTKEAQGKIRDIGGWVISEEIKACISYVNRHKCSRSTNVVREIEKTRKIKVILDKLKNSKQQVLETSKCPETLEHITLYDKGGKTYVTDAVFDFFIKVSAIASEQLSEKNIHAFKQNTLSVAYDHLSNSVTLKESFRDLVYTAASGDNATNNMVVDTAVDHSSCLSKPGEPSNDVLAEATANDADVSSSDGVTVRNNHPLQDNISIDGTDNQSVTMEDEFMETDEMFLLYDTSQGNLQDSNIAQHNTIKSGV